MKQIIVRRMTLGDFIANLFYRLRFWSYRKIFKWKLKNNSPENKEGLDLTFVDEFEVADWGTGYGRDKYKWIVGEAWGSFHPRKNIQYYGPPEIVEGTSCAKFTLKYNPKTFPDDKITGEPITIPFQNSLLSSHYSFRQQHGQFECRCTLPYDKGVWPAWWMYGNGWPPEIDIFETYGGKDGKSAGKQCINLHYGKNDQPETRGSSGSWEVKIDTIKNKDAFHEFTVKWTDKKIEMFTDGVKIFRYSRKEILDKWFNNDADMQLLVNHGMNMTTVGRDETDYYSEFLVDYVRAYKKK